MNILSPGPGVGGHCIAVDPWFLAGDYPEQAKLIRQARLINEGMPDYVLERVYHIMEKENRNDYERIGFYGLSYKENVDDVRESPTLQAIESMRRHLSRPPKCYDPLVLKDVAEEQYHDLTGFLADVDVVIVMVRHDRLLKEAAYFSRKIILDTRNCGDIWPQDNRVYPL
ncbi:MAG TPA: hypothetical protein IAA21_13200 [Candidatus Blautia faecigallinarum]|uniref:UDP-glucose/GDP-mannose dehydrogenase C-terminal domain-containing protein n=1 Tax=Candidatus Blautia faecigallinarum TaxID=2838488 RepID=A0A9D2DVD6_9FIRM|nr:hypothetical protein [Candidatus Blautia faecigallinarum]